MYNPGPNYLSAGEISLPFIYAMFSLAYFGMICAWIWFYMLPHRE